MSVHSCTHDIVFDVMDDRVILSCIRTLIRGIEINCDPALTVMSKIPWGTLQSVGDQSEYITMIGSVLNECIPIMKDGLGNVKYFKMFCDKFAEYVDSASFNF